MGRNPNRLRMHVERVKDNRGLDESSWNPQISTAFGEIRPFVADLSARCYHPAPNDDTAAKLMSPSDEKPKSSLLPRPSSREEPVASSPPHHSSREGPVASSPPRPNSTAIYYLRDAETLRIEARYTINKLAQAAGVDRATIKKLEKRHGVTKIVVYKVFDALQYVLEELDPDDYITTQPLH